MRKIVVGAMVSMDGVMQAQFIKILQRSAANTLATVNERTGFWMGKMLALVVPSVLRRRNCWPHACWPRAELSAQTIPRYKGRSRADPVTRLEPGDCAARIWRSFGLRHAPANHAREPTARFVHF